MKKTTILGLLLISTLLSYSHHLVNLCWSNGRYSIQAVDAPTGQTIHVTLINGTGTFDSTFISTGPVMTFTVPQPNVNTPVDVWVEYGDGITNLITTGINSCSVLSVSSISLTYEKIDEYINIYFTVSDEVNVKHYRVLVSTDGVSYKEITLIIPDQRKGRKTYLYTLKP